MRKYTLILFAFLFIVNFLSLGQDDFSKEKAFEHVKYLADTIGPRPMGSPQEKASLEYAAAKLAEYGCEVQWQFISQSSRHNTNSGNVIGRFRGLSDKEIVIGAHIDSAGPEIPGANDDASGVAIVLELARILCQQPHQSTLVFVAFGGEESGLVGSYYFVEHYALQNVALMLQLDMASNDAPLMLWIDTPEHQAPEWLVSAAIDIYHSLGYRNIDYPTHFQTFNKSIGGGAGSDHEPFMKKGIAAIGFVSDVTFPIHTRNDSVEYFEVDGLERSGKLVLELIKRFDREQPKEKKGHYMLCMLWGEPFFISPILIIIFIIISIIVAGIALYFMRKRREGFEEDKKIRLSWPKLAILLFIIVTVMFASEWFIQLLKGQRFSWYAHPNPHLLYTIPFILLGIWLALQTLWKWRLRKDIFFYLIRAAIYLAVLVVLFWIAGGPRLALYPAFGLLFISLSCIVPWGWLKGLLMVISPYMIFRLIVPEYYQFGYRSLAKAGQFFNTPGRAFLFSTGLVVFFVFLSMPFLLGFASIYRSYSGDLFWLKRYRKKLALIPIGILIIGGAIYLYILPGYTSTWEQAVTVFQKYDWEDKRTFIEFSSNDYLKGIEANIDGKHEKIDIRKCVKELEYPLEMDWIKVGYVCQPKKEGAEELIYLNIMLEFEKQPFGVRLRLDSDGELSIEKCNVKYNRGLSPKSIDMHWYSFPQGELQPELILKMTEGTNLDAAIEATFLDTPIVISCIGENKHFVQRATITNRITLLKGE